VVAGATATVDVSLVPQPVINNISPAAGPEGASVTISGSNFGSTQGSSTVTFNGVAATPTSWGATTIIAPAPAGATTGPVVVTVLGTDSNGLTFTVLPVGGIAGTVTRASDASPINGALVEALQSGVVKESTTTGAPGSYSMSSIVAGSYDVRISAAGYLSKLSIGVLVGGATTTVNAALVKPGTLSGKITQTDGTTPIAGAAVEASQGTAIAGTTTTNAGGDYSVGGLSPGNFTVQASAIGYNPQLQTGVSITEDANTTLNLSLAAAPPSAGVSYVYDQLGRLIAVIDPTGDTAVYHLRRGWELALDLASDFESGFNHRIHSGQRSDW
jgi:Carboxypeptidase regulatory-like domain/IPT/TIG domain